MYTDTVAIAASKTPKSSVNQIPANISGMASTADIKYVKAPTTTPLAQAGTFGFSAV
ncbi:hypothetical protein [Microcoleus vaginatus]|uniref:hypothetical protein n=1 Tax=Microcoleus vaginatus TaxID=119532 RepID=UPI00403F13C0